MPVTGEPLSGSGAQRPPAPPIGRVLAGAALCVTLGACGSSSSPGAVSTVAASTDPAAGTVSAPLSAAGLVEVLVMAGLPIADPLVYTEATDPDHILGRPGGSSGRAAWRDTRVQPGQAKDRSAGAVDLGGGIEVFATSDGAMARARSIRASPQRARPGEYDHVVGGVLLRLSALLTPVQAQQYVHALSSTTGATPVALTT
ncbi:MAG TPA: hypothetical protein VI248_28455 [Kineosporiaceae bacterium]